MDSYEYTELLKALKTKCENIEKIIKPDMIKSKLSEIQERQNDPATWSDSALNTELGKQKVKLQRLLDTYQKALDSINDANELFSLSQDDEGSLEILFSESENLKKSIVEVELAVLLNGEHDDSNAIFTITPGAGGTESQDWASILYRMYLRWAERSGYKVELLDYNDGEEAGIKGVGFVLKGENAYGYAKSESGIHRLVRISPFDANAKRHTSFASVEVTPEIEDSAVADPEDKDMRIDTYRASGAGGQHINKTESAIRITHLPTGIVVQCQNDRSQHKNKATALKMLKSKLYELEERKKQEAQNLTEKSAIGWGHQIRSYVLAPYQQVKDLRSNIAYSNVDDILDGNIKEIIEGVLIAKSHK